MRGQGPKEAGAVGAAMRFAGAIVIYLLVGLALDRWIDTTPLFTLIGMVVGSVLAFLSIKREGKMRSWSDKPRDSDSP